MPGDKSKSQTAPKKSYMGKKTSKMKRKPIPKVKTRPMSGSY